VLYFRQEDNMTIRRVYSRKQALKMLKGLVIGSLRGLMDREGIRPIAGRFYDAEKVDRLVQDLAR